MKNYIYGKNACINALERNDTIQCVYLMEQWRDPRILQLIRRKGFPLERKSVAELNEMLPGKNHQGIVIELNEYDYYELDDLLADVSTVPYPCLAILDGIEDPHNFGAILRSGDAFGIVGLTNVVSHVSTGAIEYAKVARVSNLCQAIQRLKEEGYWIVASDASATQNYREIDYRMKSAILIGSEGKGIRPILLKNSDFITKIPMYGHVGSLNVSVAAALYFSAVAESRNRS